MIENEELLKYFDNDELAADVWKSKYQVKNDKGEALERTPDEMHKRLAKEFAQKEYDNLQKDRVSDNLSTFGQVIQKKIGSKSLVDLEQMFFEYFDKFSQIVPQGSIMSILGHPTKVGSLSNCFVVPAPHDSYGGIMKTDEHLSQLMKRRGGVGTNLNGLRPSKTLVSNAAGTSTGAVSFMPRYSNTTREVAQDGRRGALMLLLHCLHPDIFDFVKIKKDRTKVTGANISVLLTDTFMSAAKADEDFYCRFPIDQSIGGFEPPEYNTLVETSKGKYIMRIKAKELFDLIIEMAHENAEPGIAFIDRIIDFSPDGVYEMYKAIASNPCGEQWLQAYDSCRLLAINLFCVVKNPFTERAFVDYEKLYEVAYMQQRLADTLVDLEIEYVGRIIAKIDLDPEPEDVKRVEKELWQNVLKTAQAGRRTGCGFTALADMLAALNLKYDSKQGIEIIEEVCKVKMCAELDCSIDLAILRGAFEGWDPKKEFEFKGLQKNGKHYSGKNKFYQMLIDNFQEQVLRMYAYGRRNVSWSTVAPTGTVSIMTQTSSGLEPLFLPYYMRRKKINPSDKHSRVDFTDQNGDQWQEFPIMHPKFKEWIEMRLGTQSKIEDQTKDDLDNLFKISPWYASTANDIDWTKRVEIQAIIQKYTTNAISSTINLPNNVTKEEVASIYWRAWELGLKGVTVYRDGCRTGVLVSNEASSVTKEVAFSQKDAAKRPTSLDCEIHAVKVKGVSYSVIVSVLNDHPYEVFILSDMVLACSKGVVTKEKKGLYNLYNVDGSLCSSDIGSKITEEEAAITRLLSTSLRHGTNVRFLVEQLNKTEGLMVGFSKAIARCLKKYIPEGTTSKEECPECKQPAMVYEEGCKKCKNCGYSKC